VNRVRTRDIEVVLPRIVHRQIKDTEKGFELRFKGKDLHDEPE
jgi:hypothetical protein